jgi:hypothetical protein
MKIKKFLEYNQEEEQEFYRAKEIAEEFLSEHGSGLEENMIPYITNWLEEKGIDLVYLKPVVDEILRLKY